ncbi:MAG: Mur ligase family protein, partial [Thermodesulfobacteriota bacterium]
YEDYIEAKAKIFSNQTDSDFALLNQDDPEVMKLAERVRARKFFFSLNSKLPKGAFSNGETIYLRLNGIEEEYSLTRVHLKGI